MFGRSFLGSYHLLVVTMVTNGSVSMTITTPVDDNICDIYFLIQASEHSSR